MRREIKRETKITETIILWVTIIFAALISGLIYAERPYVHDDLQYLLSNTEWISTHHPAWLRWPTHVIGCWLDLNGRLADSTNMLWIGAMPPVISGFAEVLMMFGMYAGMILWLSRLGYGINIRILTTALMMFGLPWWDGYGLFVVHINYVWGSTLLLILLYLILCKPPRNTLTSILMGILAFICGAWHEAIGFPLLAALCIALPFTPALRNRYTLPVVIAAIMGGIYSFTSPAAWGRLDAVSQSIPDDPLIPLILKTVPIPLILLIILVIKLTRNPKRLWTLLTDSGSLIGVMSAISLISAAMAISAGVVGRSGWFAQLTAYIALLALIAQTRKQKNKKDGSKEIEKEGGNRWYTLLAGIVGILICMLMITQTITYYIYQRQFDKETENIIKAYYTSTDGVVHHPLPTYSNAPVWLLNRAHPLPPVNEPWNREQLQRAYRYYHPQAAYGHATASPFSTSPAPAFSTAAAPAYSTATAPAYSTVTAPVLQIIPPPGYPTTVPLPPGLRPHHLDTIVSR